MIETVVKKGQTNIFDKLILSKHVDIWKLDRDQKAVYGILKNHIGKDESIKSRGITELTGFRDVQIRCLISSMVGVHGFPICSGGRGFFIAKDQKELEEHCSSMQRRAIMILKRVSKLRRLPLEDIITESKGLLHQMELEEERRSAA